MESFLTTEDTGLHRGSELVFSVFLLVPSVVNRIEEADRNCLGFSFCLPHNSRPPPACACCRSSSWSSRPPRRCLRKRSLCKRATRDCGSRSTDSSSANTSSRTCRGPSCIHHRRGRRKRGAELPDADGCGGEAPDHKHHRGFGSRMAR